MSGNRANPNRALSATMAPAKHEHRQKFGFQEEGEDAGPEVGHGLVLLVAGLDVHPFHQHHEPRQADGKRREEVVKTYGQAELQSRQKQGIQFHGQLTSALKRVTNRPLFSRRSLV